MTVKVTQDSFNRLHNALTGAMRKDKSTPRNTVSIPSDPLMENVYKLIPEEYLPSPKDQRYRSKFAEQARKEYKANVKPAASMGPLKVPLPPKTEFLKKGGGVSKPKVPISQHDRSIVKPKLQMPKEEITIPKCSKDFIKQNALDNINSLPKKLTNDLPSYLGKKDYGKVPDYLRQRIQEMKEDELALANLLAKKKDEREVMALEAQGIVVLPEEERERILKGLQDNWEKLNKDYQRLSLTVDTVPKIARKVNMEQQLKQYEELIEKFSHTKIHVNFASVYQ